MERQEARGSVPSFYFADVCNKIGPTLPTRRAGWVGSYPGYSGRDANVATRAARDRSGSRSESREDTAHST